MEESDSQKAEAQAPKKKTISIFEIAALLGATVGALAFLWAAQHRIGKPAPKFRPPEVHAAPEPPRPRGPISNPAYLKVSEFIVGKQSYSGRIFFKASGKDWKLSMVLPYSAEYEGRLAVPDTSNYLYRITLVRTFGKTENSEKGKVPDEARLMAKTLIDHRQSGESRLLWRTDHTLYDVEGKFIYGCYDSSKTECNRGELTLRVAPSKAYKGCIENVESANGGTIRHIDCGMKKIPHVVMETSGTLEENGSTMNYSIRDQTEKYR